MSEITEIEKLTPFEQSKVRAELFAANLVITSYVQELVERATVELSGNVLFEELPQEVKITAEVDKAEAIEKLQRTAAVYSLTSGYAHN